MDWAQIWPPMLSGFVGGLAMLFLISWLRGD